ncbi:PREDICTED: zinc finger protein 474-like isoform X2 [Nicrophorus vespilloides]|uniref:Zinc finger protein 474-like isoform X2 n=1 Tax=Nicrophorus vespilloides TaxID=110193 RepID=A0ABM1MP09_NICVS|nr:PREDICTED: zinc finger protein 474-like isoform X2 [Nicrophorus vespilloides]
MKQRRSPKENHTKTFLVLPLVASNEEMTRNPGLRLFTKTWPSKDKDVENKRPQTATLERPQILDIRLATKIDMSLLRKEFLTITNLCRIPLATINRTKPKTGTALVDRRRPVSNLPKPISPHSGRIKVDEITGKVRSPTIITTTASKKPDDINNNLKALRKRSPGKPSPKLRKSTKLLLPEPCTTCGRPDQPERFHSHPVTPLKPHVRKCELKVVKNSVQKPLAIKYKSTKPPNKIVLPSQSAEPNLKPMKPTKGPRTLTCYLCGREFGTTSLPLHEPKCLEKWERENANLPTHLRKKPPPKPSANLDKEEWNKFAWKASQAALTACQNCGRTFYPDRLLVHQKSCKAPLQGFMKSNNEPLRNYSNAKSQQPLTVKCSVCGKLFGTKSIKIHEPQCLKKWHIQNDDLPAKQREPMAKDIAVSVKTKEIPPKPENKRPTSGRKPPMFPCYLCGRLFGVSSIYIHEPQCLKKWTLENDKLPPNKRRQVPLKPDIKFTPSGNVDFIGTFDRIWENHLNGLVPCPKCGRTFFPERIERHVHYCKGYK